MKKSKKEIMAKEKVMKTLEDQVKSEDTEIAHINADMAICEFLETIGYAEITEMYKKVPKWY